MKRASVVRAFAMATIKIDTAMRCARHEANASEDMTDWLDVEGMETSCAAAEHLSRAITGMLGAQPGSRHDANTNADVLDRTADATADHEHAQTLRARTRSVGPTVRRTAHERSRTTHARSHARAGNGGSRTSPARVPRSWTEQ